MNDAVEEKLTTLHTESGATAASAITGATFVDSFISSLVVHQVAAIRPHDARARRGFARVLEIVDAAVRDLKSGDADRRLLRQVVRLRNELKPSSSGSYDGLEAALRSVQLTLSSCPNPFYTEIAFTLSESYAEAKLEEAPEVGRRLADESAKAFLAELDA